MSVKYIWWSHAKRMVAVYPQRREQYLDMIEPGMVPANDGMPHGTKVSSPTENTLIAAEDREAYRDYWTVRRVLDAHKTKGNYDLWIRFIELYYWTTPRVKLSAIADIINVSYDTVLAWNKTLIREVGIERGWL